MTNLRSLLANWVPPWLSPRALLDNGFRFLFAFGLFVDVTIQAAILAVEAALPSVATFTALYLIGRDRRIKRGRAETADAYRLRLNRWRYDWQRAGNPYTIMRQVQAYLYPKKPRLRIVNSDATWYTLNSDGTFARTPLAGNWDWDGQAATLRSRWWLIIESTGPEAPWTRDGTWGDGQELWGSSETSTWGSTATVDQVRDIREIVGEFKSVTGLCEHIIVSFDAAAFSPAGTAPPNADGTWGGDYKIVGGVAVPNRDSRGIYWQGAA